MDFWQYLMLAAVVASLWLGRWNGTCWALALAYFAVQAWWLIAGTLQPGDLFMVDLVTVLLIYCKAIARDTECIEYRSGWHQLQCFMLAPTAWDRIILASFAALVWPLYVLNLDDFARWYALWGVSMAQLAVAGGEALIDRRKAKAPASIPGNPSSGLQFASMGPWQWST